MSPINSEEVKCMEDSISQNQINTSESLNMALSTEEFPMNNFKIDFNSSRNDFHILNPMKQYIKEEPCEVPCSQLSPLSPTSSGLGSSFHSQSPQNNLANYIASLTNNQQQPVNNTLYINNSGGDPILTAASLNIKNEAFSPQSMDICN